MTLVSTLWYAEGRRRLPSDDARERLMLGRIKAYSMLAVSFVLTLLSRWLHLGRRFGLGAYERNYAADRLAPMQAGDGELFVGAGRCIACGRCEEGDYFIKQRHPSAYPGLMTLVLAGARATPDAVEAASAWRLIDEQELSKRQRLCPTQVPLVELSRFVRRHAEQLEDSASGS